MSGSLEDKQREITMKLLHDLLFTDYGLMSLIGMLFMLGMGVFFVRLFLNKITLTDGNTNIK
jgi:hypothetical protein